MASPSALHSSEEDDHGTPESYVELSRYAQGGIDCDPCSSAYWNHWTVKARTFYDERIDGLKAPWFGKIHVNAPSSRKKKISVRPWWEKLIECYASGAIESACWIGFTLEQLTNLQSAPMHPAQFFMVIPCDRGKFLKRNPGGPPVKGESPTHGNFIALLPSRKSPTYAREMVRRFCERAASLEGGGAIVRPL